MGRRGIIADLRARRGVRAVARAVRRRTSCRGSEYITPTHIPGPGELDAVPARPRPLRRRRALQAHLGRAGIAHHRRRLDGLRPDRRHAHRLSSPACSAAGSTTSSCASSTSCCRCRACCSPSRSRRCSARTQLSVMIAIGVVAGADLRAPAALLDAAAAQRGLRAVGADARPRPRQDHDEPRAAERGRTRHRAGHADPRDGRHRGGRAVVPRPRRRTCRRPPSGGAC